MKQLSHCFRLALTGAGFLWNGRIKKEGVFLLCPNEHQDLGENADFMKMLRELADESVARYENSFKQAKKFTSTLSDAIFGVPFHLVMPPSLSSLLKRVFVPLVIEKASGCRVWDIDGNEFIDVGNSYSVNLLGNGAQYLMEAAKRVQEKGYCLGPLTEDLAKLTDTILEASGMEMVSYHNSGTEAIMAAARSARINTGREWLVSFGSYHGWWDDVLTNDLIRNTHSYAGGTLSKRTMFLKPYDKRSLKKIVKNSRKIAAILVDPRQGIQHQNMIEDVSYKKEKQWLHSIQRIARQHQIPFILDEVVTGFHIDYYGAKKFFDLDPDYIIYGKCLGAGTPVGVVCGRRTLMGKNYFNLGYDPLDDLPAIADDEIVHRRGVYLAPGTFSRNPMTVSATKLCLDILKKYKSEGRYQNLNNMADNLISRINAATEDLNIKSLRFRNFGPIWSMCHNRGTLYDILLKASMMRQGILVNAIGSGLCGISFEFTENDITECTRRITAALSRIEVYEPFFDGQQHLIDMPSDILWVF